MIELFFEPTILFIFSSPQEWVLVIAAVMILGSGRLFSKTYEFVLYYDV